MIVINTNSKRGKGKLKVNVNNNDFYNEYKRFEESKGKNIHPMNTYRKVLDSFNKRIADLIVYNNETFEFPYRLGYLGVIKYEVVYDLDKKHLWKADYKRSKEIGQIVYFDQPYRYKWKWDKCKKLVGKRWYRFQPCRTASRSITLALNSNKNLDYCEKLNKS